MVNRTEALIRLNKEKAYEDELVRILAEYFIACLGTIPDISEEEHETLHDRLLTIKQDSEIHSYKFNSMVQMVFENEDDFF